MSDQRLLATNPSSSAWVSASAGTGKTRLLSARVLRLLLEGVLPSKILCLTFTNAAASEMSNRINQELSEWSIMDPDALKSRLLDLTGYAPSPKQTNHARKLFLLVLDAPEGLKIQTIHGFCQTLIQKFAIEAGLPPNCSIIDSNEVRLLLQEAKINLLSAENQDYNTSVLQAIDRIAWHIHDNAINDLIDEIIKNRTKFSDMFSSYNHDIAKLIHNIYHCLNATPNVDEQVIINNFWLDKTNHERLQHIVPILLTGTNSDSDKGIAIREWLNTSDDNKHDTWETYKKVFLTSSNTPTKTLATKSILQKHPEVGEILALEQQRIIQVMDKYHAAKIANLSKNLIQIAYALIEEYNDLKKRQLRLDYNDLIEITCELLNSDDFSQWILYKLDGGVDHVFIDEAQDTSRKQSHIIDKLVSDFFAGDDNTGQNRTLFIVGDDKQSIFSFQGANPATFADIKDYFRTKAAPFPFHHITLSTSFRSAPAILKFVDEVFSEPELKKAVTDIDTPILHQPFKKNVAGSVELWPLVSAGTSDGLEPWELPITYKTKHNQDAILAKLIAYKIKSWLCHGKITGESTKKVTPGDIMILVRKRDDFTNLLIRALKANEIPVAGLDKLVLTKHIAIMDLLALGQFLLLPDDDYNLACVLKSPLIGLNEDELCDLATTRGTTSLWSHLKLSSNRNMAYLEAYQYLAELQELAKILTPFFLYSHIIEVQNGRQKLCTRLSTEINELIDEFLNLLVDYESSHTPSLQGFIHFIKNSASEIKRDLHHANDQVRILTVHSAKGLQAPIVIVPDADIKSRPPLLLWDDENQMVFWPIKQEYDVDYCKNLKQRKQLQEINEHWRLLYVALTRAEDELIICGKEKRATQHSWYHTVKPIMQTMGQVTPFDAPEELALSLTELNAISYASGSYTEMQQVSQHASEPASLPGFVDTLPINEQLLHYLTPATSKSYQSNPLSGSETNYLLHGQIAHKLLQILPQVPDEHKSKVAARMTENFAPNLNQDVKAAIITSCLNITTSAQFRHLFSPNSLAEVPVIGVLDNQYIISGKIDRLVKEKDRIIIIEYKTSNKVPGKNQELPAAYLRQMSAYRQLVTKIYPNHKIECFILWVNQSIIAQIDNELLANYQLH